MLEIRAVKPDDAESLVKIYNYYILNTAISYEYDVLNTNDFLARIEKISASYPYLVATENGKLLGYAYASSFHERKAFDWDVEISLYLDKNETGKGVGKILMEKLLAILQQCNYVNVYSLINSPNSASLALHKKFGFEQCGICKGTGFKHGQWRDLLTLEKRFCDFSAPKQVKKDWKAFL